MAIINDFKAIGQRVREISRHTLGEQKHASCGICNNLGWVLHPHPRAGFPDIPMVCSGCNNPNGLDCPFIRDDSPAPIGIGAIAPNQGYRCQYCGSTCFQKGRPARWFCDWCSKFVA